MSDAVNIFKFPYLSLAAGTEASLVVWRLDTVLEYNMLTSYADTAALMTKQKIMPIFGLEGVVKILDPWLVLPDIILGPPEIYPAVHDISVLVEVSEEVNTRLYARVYHQPDMPSSSHSACAD